MATKAPDNPIIRQKIADWSAFVRKYTSKGLSNVHDEASWYTWKKQMKEIYGEDISDKYYLEYRPVFEEYGGYRDDFGEQEEEDTHGSSHHNARGSSHGGTHTPQEEAPLKEEDKEKAVNTAEEIIRQHAKETTEETPAQVREREKKEAAAKIIKRFFKENPVNYRHALVEKYMPSDPRFAEFAKEEEAPREHPMHGELGDTRVGDNNEARERFLAYHKDAVNDYYKKERATRYETKQEDSMWQASVSALEATQARLSDPANEYYQPYLSLLGAEQVRAIGEDVYTEDFAQFFPENAEAYAAMGDEEMEEAVQSSYLESMSAPDETEEPTSNEGSTQGQQGEGIRGIPSLPRRRPHPQSQEEGEKEGGEEKDKTHSHTRDEKQEQANRSNSKLSSLQNKINNNPFAKGKRAIKNKLNQGKQAAKDAVKNAAKQAVKKAVKEGAKQLAEKGLAATAEYWVPVVVIIIIIILLIIFILMLFGMGGQTAQENSENNIPVTITKTVDKTELPNPSGNGDETLTYTITRSYKGLAQGIITRDVVPTGTEYVSADGNPTLLDEAGNNLTDTPENKAKVKAIVWDTGTSSNAATTTSTPSPSTDQATSVNVQTYTQPPYLLPSPNGPSDTTFSNEVITNLNTLGTAVAKNQAYLKTKAKNQDGRYVDPFLSVIWTGAIEGTGANPYSWNCQDNPKITINDGCAGGFYSGGWQVGYGIQVSQAASHLEEDFNAVYGAGSANDATKVAQVGQAVIANSANAKGGRITNPSTFPSETVAALVAKAESGDTSSQQALAILLMDPNLGAISIALEVAGDIASQDNWRATMSGWGSYYVSNMQNFSNRMAEIAKHYNGISGESGTAGTLFPDETYHVVLKVTTAKDTYLYNTATSTVIGATNSSTQTSTTTTMQGGGITLSGLPIKQEFLPLPSDGNCALTVTESCGRPGKMVTPKKIVEHITASSSDAEGISQYFASGSDNRGVASHFVVGTDGEIIQLVPLQDTTVEVAYAVANYSDHISIEIVSPTDFTSKNALPKAQYDAVLKLTQALMNQYHIPVGEKDENWTSGVDEKTDETNQLSGVLGHYQLNPLTRTDPGKGFMKDIRADLQSSK